MNFKHTEGCVLHGVERLFFGPALMTRPATTIALVHLNRTLHIFAHTH